MTQFPSGGPRFDDAARSVAAALLDTLLPASEDGRMPSAADVGFLEHLARFQPGYVAEFADVLRVFDAAFAVLDLPARVRRVEDFSAREPAAFGRLILRVYDCYYQDPGVRAAIGATGTPPFPRGNPLHEGDLSLLDPVIRDRERHRYRPA